jgi:ABC-type uncharacterized transport system substrate-binding protein
VKSHKAFLFGIFRPGDDGAADLEAFKTLHCDFKEIEKQATPMAAKIIKGVKPIDIPSQIPLSHRLTVNLKTAKHLGIATNPHLLSLAHWVIE